MMRGAGIDVVSVDGAVILTARYGRRSFANRELRHDVLGIADLAPPLLADDAARRRVSLMSALT
jgi:hypothetical protein